MIRGGVVGIAIRAGFVEAVELAAEETRPVLVRAVCEPIPPGAFADGAIANPTIIAKTVRRLLKRHGLPLHDLFLAVGGVRTIARVVELVAASPAEAEQALQDRVARYAVYEDVEVIWQAAPVADATRVGGETGPERVRMDKSVYLAAAADAEEISRLLRALHAAGIRASYVEPSALAILRALEARLGESPSAGLPSVARRAKEGGLTEDDSPPTILISLGREGADFVIAKGKLPLLIRSVSSGASASVPVSGTPIGDADSSLLVEARRSIEFCQTRCPHVAPRIWVWACADSDRTSRLAERLKEASLPATIQPAPPWPARHTEGGPARTPDGAEGVRSEKDEAGDPAWAAVGAALAASGRTDVVPMLNLVPAEWTAAQKVRRQVLGFISSIAAVMLVACVLTTVLRLTAGDLARRVEAAAIQMHRNTSEVLSAAELKHRTAAAVERARLWNRVRAHLVPFDWVRGLQAVVDQTPEGVRVVKLACRRDTLQVVGEARTSDDVHEFVRRLASLRILDEAKIERLKPAPAGGANFVSYTITGRFHQESVSPSRVAPCLGDPAAKAGSPSAPAGADKEESVSPAGRSHPLGEGPPPSAETQGAEP